MSWVLLVPALVPLVADAAAMAYVVAAADDDMVPAAAALAPVRLGSYSCMDSKHYEAGL